MTDTNFSMDDKRLTSAPAREYRLTQQARPRGLPSQISTVLLQPVLFFRTLAPMHLTRQWLWVGLLILILVGYTAVRQADLVGGSTDTTDTGFDTGFEDPGFETGGDPVFGFPPEGGGEVPIDTGFPPEGAGGTGTSGSTADPSTTVVTAVRAAGAILIAWVIQSFLLATVPAFNGKRPDLGRGFQVALWASVPLGLMCVVQLGFFAMGGKPGESGVVGVLKEWPGLADQTELGQKVLISLASMFTLFWVWNIVLLYVGARHALRGRWWASLLSVGLWVMAAALIPVISGQIEAPESPLTEESLLDEGFMDEGELDSGDEMPFDDLGIDPNLSSGPFESATEEFFTDEESGDFEEEFVPEEENGASEEEAVPDEEVPQNAIPMPPRSGGKPG